jgi:hypothetical protein
VGPGRLCYLVLSLLKPCSILFAYPFPPCFLILQHAPSLIFPHYILKHAFSLLPSQSVACLFCLAPLLVFLFLTGLLTKLRPFLLPPISCLLFPCNLLFYLEDRGNVFFQNRKFLPDYLVSTPPEDGSLLFSFVSSHVIMGTCTCKICLIILYWYTAFGEPVCVCRYWCMNPGEFLKLSHISVPVLHLSMFKTDFNN